jgi:hypothetical protein
METFLSVYDANFMSHEGGLLTKLKLNIFQDSCYVPISMPKNIQNFWTLHFNPLVPEFSFKF